MDADEPTGPMTRSKTRLLPKPQEPEPQSQSDDDSWNDRSMARRPGPHRLQQPPVYVNANLNKIKMEVDYNPIIAQPKEEKADDDGDDENEIVNRSTTNDNTIDCETAHNCGVLEETISDSEIQNQRDYLCAELQKKTFMDSHQSLIKGPGSNVVKVGDWVRREYFVNVVSHKVQLEKPIEWLEYEEQQGTVPSQSSSTTTSNTPTSSLSSLQSHQPSSSSSNIFYDNIRSNTVFSETEVEFLQQQGNSSSLQVSDLHLLHSQVPSSSHQLDNSNMGHELCDLGQEQSEDQNLEPMDKNRAPEKRKKNPMDSHQSSSKGIDSTANLQQNQDSLTISSDEEEIVMTKRRKEGTHPLQMKKTLGKIFSFLDANSIKAARQVNVFWKDEGAKSLITTCYVKIPSEVHQAGESPTKNKTLRKFKYFLSQNSEDSPVISNIIVETIDDVELWESLGVLGQEVKSLKFTLMDDQNILLHDILNLLPNLKYLNCVEIDRYNNKSVIIEVIVSAMSEREQEESSLTISCMVLEPHNEEELEVVEDLADCKNVVIEELKLLCPFPGAPNREARLANVLSKLLSNSQNVLKKLTLYNCEYYLPLLEFPCMTTLTHLDLNFFYPDGGPSCKFSPSFRFSEKVPNLQEIRVSYSSESTDFLQNLLESAGAAPSVKRVNCIRSYRDTDVDALFQAFPNIEELELHVYWNAESKFRSLWALGKNLKKLTLNIDWDPKMESLLDLDYFLTGFDAETISKIKETPNLDPFTLEELKELRVNPSISNLKELEHLSIHLSSSCKPNLSKRMLTVTAKYEISRLPKNPKISIAAQDSPGFWMAFEEVSKLPSFFVQL